ncbi:MAG: hypothetical protein HY855_00435 [Burkholderiales bacterium]|nr:hypothetical protein [Burkholderiales bacterium]
MTAPRPPRWPRRARGLVAALVLWLQGAAVAATLVVGPGTALPSFAQAIARARDGDTIEILPGTYRGDVAVITQRQLTIRGHAPRPVFVADGRHAEGKAQWVVRNGDIRIENVEFRGTRVPDRNGAGIRFERGHLRLKGCAFFDNEMGLLTADSAESALDIEDSEFGQAPRDRSARHHLLYVGGIGRFSITGSRFHNGYQAHLIKSRARVSRIAYNLLVDGPDGEAAYEIDLPNGGEAWIIGNVIGQSASTSNPVLVSFGAEGKAWPNSALRMAHNTLLSDRLAGAWFVRVWADKLPPGVPVDVVNNLSVGIGLLSPGAPGRFEGNAPALARMLADPNGFDFRLAANSVLRGSGVPPRLPDGTDLAPHAQFRWPLGTEPIVPPTRWTPGAYQPPADLPR